MSDAVVVCLIILAALITFGCIDWVENVKFYCFHYKRELSLVNMLCVRAWEYFKRHATRTYLLNEVIKGRLPHKIPSIAEWERLKYQTNKR